MARLSLKSISISLLSLVILLFLYLCYSYYSSPTYTIPGNFNNIVFLKDISTNCSLMYDTTEIVESDARVVFALLQKYGIYSPGVRNARAVFFKEKEKTYSLLLFASKKAMTSPSAENMAKEILRKLKSNYMDRKFYFLITADSSGSSMWPKKIQLD